MLKAAISRFWKSERQMQDTITICSTSRCVPSSSGVLSQRLPSKDPCTNFVHDASLLNDCSATIQWNRVRRVKHGGHQFHHSIELHAPVGVLQSHGQSLRFCAYRLVADREDVAEGKTFRPTTLLVHPSRSGDYDWKTLESTDVQPTQPAIFYLKDVRTLVSVDEMGTQSRPPAARIRLLYAIASTR
ncbi:hypothetical protein T01_12165, partial [Trichinella spiralis]